VRLVRGLGPDALALQRQALELSIDPLDPLLAPGSVPVCLDRVMADDVALGGGIV
jgi:hypothetical protein